MRALHMISGIRKTLPIKVLSVAITWVTGLLAGFIFLHQTTFISLMCSVHFLRTSIIGLLFSLAIPLLLTYILLRFFNFYCILPLIFLKAFSFICTYSGLMITFGNAGWLICGMILFSDFILVVLLLLQWFHAAIGKKCRPLEEIIVYCLIPIFTVCLDYLVVSPYVAMLLNY